MKQIDNAVMLGAWAWGSGFAGGDQVFGRGLDTEGLRPVVDTAMRLGLNRFDTAAVYGEGTSESILGELIAEYPRNEVFISTKFTPQIADTSATLPVQAMIEGSLKRLKTDHIDLYWIHNANDVERWTPQIAPLVKDGLVKELGVSNHSLAQLKRVIKILDSFGCRLSAVQNHLSLIHRNNIDDGMLEFCRANGIVYYAYMVLEQGALTARYNADNPMPQDSGRGQFYNGHWTELSELNRALVEVGQAHEASAAQIAAAWAMAKGTVPILGVTKARQVEDAYKAASLKLSADEILTLESLAARVALPTLRAWEA